MLEISAPVPFFQQQQQKTLSSKKSVMYTLYQAEVQKIIAEKGREKLIKKQQQTAFIFFGCLECVPVVVVVVDVFSCIEREKQTKEIRGYLY